MNPDQRERGDLSPAVASQATQQLLHDLQVHQVALEQQNEELRRTQMALDAERARYFDLYDLAPVGYCTLNEQGMILEANLTAATLLGVARSELIRQPFSRFILDVGQDTYSLHRKRLFDSGLTQSCELRMVAHDGTSFWAHLEASIAQNADGAALHRVVLTDISDRIYLDQALHENNLELENARKVADKANRAKSEFLSSMSHELRSPLNAILGFAQLMESGSPPPTLTQKDKIDHFLQAGWYLLELINEILDLALIESGKLSLSLKTLSLADVLSDCTNMIQPLAEQNGIQVSFTQFDRPCFVHADQTRLTQLVLKLLSNAVKYNRVGGTVEVTADSVASGRLRISVRESGKGLSAEKLARLFEPFNRLGQEASAIEGAGIGLVVCKRLIEMMDGAIGVESTVGVGSVFWIELNLSATPSLATVVDEPVALQPMPLLNGSGLHTLLYVEDNPATRSIPVLAISANAMPDDIEKGLAAGFQRYLTKPIKVKELMQALDLALQVAQIAQVES